MRIQADLWDSGTPLERSAAKNYANPRYKCAEISDGDPIGDEKQNEAPSSQSSILEPGQSPNIAIPAQGAGDHEPGGTV